MTAPPRRLPSWLVPFLVAVAYAAVMRFSLIFAVPGEGVTAFWPASGILVADSHDVLVLRPVGDAEYKVRGAYNRNLKTLVLPEGNRGGLDESPLVPPEISRELVRYAASLDDAVALAFGEDVWLD